MSGHSKWNNIKRRKEATDAVKAKIFTKIGREITVCVKESGADPNSNSKLRDLISKAKSLNVPNDNIDRVIKKAAGEGDKNSYESIMYEGYGPSGVAVMVDCLTDNKNRTAGDIRHYFDKFGGNLGTPGCVSFMFTQKGIVMTETDETDEDKIMEDGMNAGADDFKTDYDEENEVNVVRFEAAVSDLRDVAAELEKSGYKILSAEPAYVPDNYTSLTDEEAIKKMNFLLEHLEDNDDVQNVFHNLED
ncbi:MAG: YebC/PmpR family DNA-binding transcriptional regulator [Ruminococcus sp.]|jgi:YebC/PmpR family DNA-binding regulatory protein|nr:YebC/PmpR family DNA-binding transcriptional regulator [Ruminococcus sp.]